MRSQSSRLYLKILVGLIACIILILVVLFCDSIWENVSFYYHLLSDRDKVRDFIASFGLGAPLIFMGIQILQVIFAPVPGEATGFIGGYLFGVLQGFIYSSVALAIGSWINFSIGRFLGVRFVRKMIPVDKFEKFDSMLKRQGIIVLFLLFVFPGFPKDYLCLFLGLSTLPLKVFILLVSVGRMPGTFLLSLQGAYLFEENYVVLGLVAAVCAVLFVVIYRYRENLYLWIERFNNK
ncbi:MAG: TVP38/TMEM64 family protein [Deltaproteobacteria bacterium]|nr:TVP38/TMEM64 family protein [Deltaproteobacteria bacterium]